MTACPLLTRGKHFGPREEWPVVMLRDVAGELDRDLGATYEFYSGHQLLAVHHRGWLTIKRGYACDGYSPVLRKKVFGKWRFIRLTPTPKAGMWPAVLHDLTRQFRDVLVNEAPVYTREDTDVWFFNALFAGGSNRHVAGTFYGAVAGPVGDGFIYLTRSHDPNLWIKRTPYP